MLNDGNRVKEIFLEAAEQPDEAACAAYLDHACGDDAGLRDRVERCSFPRPGRQFPRQSGRQAAGENGGHPGVGC